MPTIVLVTSACLLDTITITADDTEFVTVSTGVQHACSLTPDQRVVCWSSLDGRPSDVSGDVRFVSVSTRADHTCGLGVDGRAYCWGLNLAGQLGVDADLQRCPRFGRTGVPCALRPIAVDGDLTFVDVQVGGLHSCGLDDGGGVHCWGANMRGQLGTASSDVCSVDIVAGGLPCSPVPIPVDGGIVFVQLSVGTHHTCGVADDAAVYCWGENGFGRLGVGDVDSHAAPTRVAGPMAFRTVTAGGAHTCGIATDDRLHCWGSNSDLQLGSRATDRTFECGRLPFRCVAVPTPSAGDLRFRSVTTSGPVSFAGAGGPAVGGHTCGITTADATYCWGLNEDGQLPGSAAFRTDVPVRIDTNADLVQVSAGLFNTCAVTRTSTVECWAFGSPVREWKVLAEQ